MTMNKLTHEHKFDSQHYTYSTTNTQKFMTKCVTNATNIHAVKNHTFILKNHTRDPDTLNPSGCIK